MAEKEKKKHFKEIGWTEDELKGITNKGGCTGDQCKHDNFVCPGTKKLCTPKHDCTGFIYKCGSGEEFYCKADKKHTCGAEVKCDPGTEYHF